MSVTPYTVPARDRTEYPETRVSVLSVTQVHTGGPLVVSYQIDRYRLVDGVPEDAPGGRVSGNVQIGMAAAMQDPQLASALLAINTFAVTEAVKAGLLSVNS
jgi:hypothetical protein